VELRDRLDQISTNIQELHEAAGDGPRTRQLVDSLFRTVHTFKAAAAAEGLADLSRAAHEFENLLHSLRTGKVILDAEVLRVLEDTASALRKGSPAPSLHRLDELDNHTSTSEHDLPIAFATLKEEERYRAAAAMREGAELYVMEVVFEVSDFDERFRRLKEQLNKTAEIISTSATMQDDKIIFQVLYASTSEKIPVQTILQQTRLAGQAAATALGKQIEFVVKADDLLLDKSLSDALADALLHLVRNAVDHGIELHGTILIAASEEEVSVTDDGQGIAPENLPFLFQPGFSTAAEATEFSGRGVGLDAVKAAVEHLGGSVSVTSEPGKGSSFKIKIPNPSTMPNPSSDA
jgi:two-component system chemotaxis sensor kinase CheA